MLEAKVALLAVCRRFVVVVVANATMHVVVVAVVVFINFFSRFSFQPGTKMKEPLRQDPNSQLGWPRGGIWVNVQRR